LRVINEERSRLAEWRRQLEATAEKVNADRQDAEQQQRLLTVEKRKLENLAQQVRDKSAEIDELVAVCSVHVRVLRPFM
jgi:sirohydrochlorin ferrochelatase